MQKILEQGAFTFTEEDGTENEYKTLFTFYNKKYNKHYVVYTTNTDNSTEEEPFIYTSSYLPNDLKQRLYPITDTNEWEMIEKQIDEVIQQNVEEGEAN